MSETEKQTSAKRSKRMLGVRLSMDDDAQWAWYKAQTNKTASIAMLIKTAIQLYGTQDIFAAMMSQKVDTAVQPPTSTAPVPAASQATPAPAAPTPASPVSSAADASSAATSTAASEAGASSAADQKPTDWRNMMNLDA